MCICVHASLYVFVHFCICIHDGCMCGCVCVFLCMHACMHIGTRIHVCTYVHVYMYAHMYTYTCLHICTRVHVCTCVHVYMMSCVCVCTYTYTYTCIHVGVYALVRTDTARLRMRGTPATYTNACVYQSHLYASARMMHVMYIHAREMPVTHILTYRESEAKMHMSFFSPPPRSYLLCTRRRSRPRCRCGSRRRKRKGVPREACRSLVRV
jgi:hypothetical protein